MSCVYAVCIDEMSEELYREIYQRMPEDRQNRTSRYKHHTDQMRSVAAYYALERALLQFHDGVDITQELVIRYGKSGKPYLEGTENVQFSLSHSGKYAICAMSCQGSIGADILKIRKTDMRIANRFFASSEIEQLSTLQAGNEQDRLFSKIWTRKESYTKFTGDGLGVDLTIFTMELSSKRLMINQQIFPIQFYEIEEPEGYVISICEKAGTEDDLRYHQINLNKN